MGEQQIPVNLRQPVKKQEGSTGQYETNYIYSGTSVLFTTNANGGKIIDNILSPGGQVVSSKRFDGDYANEYYFFTQDIRNSTMAILDDRYDAQQYYTYDIYGKAVVEGDEDFQNDCTFTGAIAEGGDIYYMNARFYDANTGRFLTQDTYKGNAWEPMSQNLYSYVGNNPVNYIDPTGHRGEKLIEFCEWFLRKQFEIGYAILADKEAEFMLDTWIHGDGSDVYLAGEHWDEYMSEKIHDESDAASFIADNGTGDYTDFDYTPYYSYWEYGQNGYINGHQLIHIPQSVTVSGSVRYDSEKDVYYADFNFVLTDFMDPNPKEAGNNDQLYAAYMRMLYGQDKGVDYNITIAWSQSFEIAGDIVKTAQRGNSPYEVNPSRRRN